MRTLRPINRCRGFSIVELMVSMVIALVVMAGVLNSFLASRTAFQFNEELAFIQDNARYATEYLTRDIRQAGYFGCDRSNAIITNSLASNFNGLLLLDGIEGFEDAATNGPALIKAEVWGTNNANTNGTAVKSDAVIVRHADQDNTFVVDNHNVSSADIQIVGEHAFKPGTVFMVADTDCRHIGIFAMSGPTNNGGNAQHVVHNKGTSSTENCTKSIKGNGNASDDTDGDGTFDCDDTCGTNTCAWSDPTPYGPDSQLMAMTAKIFYITPSAVDATMPTLAMRRLQDQGVISPVAEELAPGIEDFQLTYGVDDDGDGFPERYYDAANVVTSSGWDKVVAVRIDLVARSQNPVLDQAEARTLLGVNYNDRYLRQLITTTILLRNYFG